ncbi:MAG: Gfo/Idh/MocA family oxidoreductase [Pseudomonadota bacterium]
MRAAILGAGFFGNLHAKKYKEVGRLDVGWVFDPDPGAAAALAETVGGEVAETAEQAIGESDLVSVAAPAAHHYALARQALMAGKPTYLEKPIALTAPDAGALVALAEARSVAFQVGHQERVVFRAFGLLDFPERPTRIAAHRAGPFTGRGTDVSAVLDLMIHDIDLVHQVAPGALSEVRAQGRVLEGPHTDEMSASFVIDGATSVSLLASRMAETRERWIELTYPSGTIKIDMLARTVENTTGLPLGSVFERTDPDKPTVSEDPLGFAIASFVEAVRDGRGALVTGAQAALALETALAVEEAATAPLAV